MRYSTTCCSISCAISFCADDDSEELSKCAESLRAIDGAGAAAAVGARANRGGAARTCRRAQVTATTCFRGFSSARPAHRLKHRRTRSASEEVLFARAESGGTCSADRRGQAAPGFPDRGVPGAGSATTLNQPENSRRLFGTHAVGGGRRRSAARNARATARRMDAPPGRARSAVPRARGLRAAKNLRRILPAHSLAAAEEGDRASRRAEANRDDSRAISGAQDFDEAAR